MVEWSEVVKGHCNAVRERRMGFCSCTVLVGSVERMELGGLNGPDIIDMLVMSRMAARNLKTPPAT